MKINKNTFGTPGACLVVSALIAATALVGFAGCQAPVAKDTAVETSTNENETVVRSMFEAFNRHDWKAMAEHYADSALFLDPSYGISFVTKSRSEIVSKYTEFAGVFPDLHDDVKNVYVSGSVVTVEFVSTGTAPDGTRFELPIACILTLKDGKIIRDATYYDMMNP